MDFRKRIANLLRLTVEEYDDPVLGPLKLWGGGDWCGEVSLDHPLTRTKSLSLLIDNGKGRPSDEQRALSHEILSRYAELWPRIAQGLASHHPLYKTVEAVNEFVDQPCLCLNPLVAEQPRRWSLYYTFNSAAEGDIGYFVDFCEWEIIVVYAAD